MNNEYLPYQKEGIQYALARHGCIIADEMGLGKTVQAIGVINHLPEVKTVLIVCPASLKINWWNEIDAWLERKETVSISVANYESLDKIRTMPIDLLILDEAHYAKNPKSYRAKQVRRLCKLAKRRLLLTGTPIENKPLELWGLLQIVNPEYWDPAGWKKVGKRKEQVKAGEGANFFNFAKRYCGAHKRIFGKKSFWDFSGASNLGELRKLLDDNCMIRRLKKDVLTQLPEKQFQLICLPSKINEDLILPELDESNFEAAIKSLYANKVLFTEYSKRRHEQGLEKVELVAEHILNCLEQDENKKLVVFAHHVDVLEAIAENINFDTAFDIMTAENTIGQRQAMVDRFQNNPKNRVIFGTDVMSTGWTLTASDQVIHAEIEPVPGNMAQRNDRVHRFGQKNNVLIQYLVLNGSLEARICKILIKKIEMLNEVLG